MANAWSPSKVPDVSDPQSPAAASGGAGALISPTGITSLEAFGACVVSTSGGGGVTGAPDAIGVFAIGER